MNPNESRVVLRPRNPFEVFDLTWRFVRVRWHPLARLGGWLLVPLSALAFLLCWLTDGHPACLLLPAIVALPLQAPFTLLTGRLLFSDEVSPREVLGDCFRLFPSLMVSWMVRVLGWSATSLTCFLALPVMDTWLAYLSEAALLERVSASRGMRRSLRLASGNPLIALMAGGSMWLLAAWMGAAAELTGMFVVDTVLQLGSPFGRAQDGVVTPWLLIGLMASQPLAAVYRLFLYVDVRTRVEGWDLQIALRAAGMGQ